MHQVYIEQKSIGGNHPVIVREIPHLAFFPYFSKNVPNFNKMINKNSMKIAKKQCLEKLAIIYKRRNDSKTYANALISNFRENNNSDKCSVRIM